MPTTFDRQIKSTIDSFVIELHDLVRQAAIASVTQAFGGKSPAAAVNRPRGSGRPRSSGGAPGAWARGGRKGQKRDPGALAALTEKLGEFIKRTPGQRIEEIAKALGTTTRDLQLPARKLIAAKRVSTKGVKRATTYQPR